MNGVVGGREQIWKRIRLMCGKDGSNRTEKSLTLIDLTEYHNAWKLGFRVSRDRGMEDEYAFITGLSLKK